MIDPVQIVTRTIDSEQAAEVYVTAIPRASVPLEAEARRMFAGIRDVLRSGGARLFQERVFAADETFEAIMAIRAETYGDLDDGVPPARLIVPEEASGKIAGIQVHAVRGPSSPEPVRLEGSVCGRTLCLGDRMFLGLSGLAAPEAGAPPDQARVMFDKALRILDGGAGGIEAVARTWWWLGDILAWYDEFNRLRTRFFSEHGLIDGRTGRVRLPASTGIGVRPAGGAACAMDLIAVTGGGEATEFLLAGGRQQPAFDYGSAFSRAARTLMPAGETLFVSGTAAIDASGATVHAGDAAAQIEATLANVRAILDGAGCRDEDVLQAIAYCKTPAVEDVLNARWADLSWPRVTAIADVCRDDLLFEIEATAVVRR